MNCSIKNQHEISANSNTAREHHVTISAGFTHYEMLGQQIRCWAPIGPLVLLLVACIMKVHHRLQTQHYILSR